MSTSAVQASPFFAPHRKTTRRHTVAGVNGLDGRDSFYDSQQQTLLSGEEPKSSIAGATFNLMNAIIGAGIVGVPYAVRECGFVWGIIMIVFCAVLTVKSLRVLIGTAKYVNVPSYEMLAEAAFGRPGFVFVSLAMFVMAYGAMVTYLMIVKNVLPDLLGVAPDDLPLRRTLLALSSFCIMLPLSAQRDMANLSKTSMISVLFDCIIVGIVSCFAPVRDNIRQSGGLLPLLVSQSSSTTTTTTHGNTAALLSLLIPSSTFFIGLGVLSFAFVCQHSAFIIAGSLAQPTRKRWAKATASALISCCILAMIMGASGYLGYLDKVQGNVLNNLVRPPSTTDPYFSRIDAVDAVMATQDDTQSQQNTYIFFHKWSHLYNTHHTLPLSPEEVALHRAANIARALLCTAMFFVYPMEAFVARHVCVVLFFRGRSAHEGDDHYVLARRDRRLTMTIALYLLALIPALCFNNVGNVLAITGAIGGSALSYIGPGAVYLAIHGKAFLDLVHQSLEKQSLLPSDSVIQEGEEETQLLPSQRIDISISVSHSTPTWYSHILWYCCCLPIWCHVAQHGQDMLKKHKEEEALKSPSIHSLATPKPSFLKNESSMSSQHRSGIPQFVVVDMKRGKLSSMGRSTSFEKTSTTPAASISVLSPKRATVVTYNSTSSTQPDSVRRSANQKVQSLEKGETEDVKPTAQDFGIAIFFIVFGIVAASAGLFSVLF